MMRDVFEEAALNSAVRQALETREQTVLLTQGECGSLRETFGEQRVYPLERDAAGIAGLARGIQRTGLTPLFDLRESGRTELEGVRAARSVEELERALDAEEPVALLRRPAGEEPAEEELGGEAAVEENAIAEEPAEEEFAEESAVEEESVEESGEEPVKEEPIEDFCQPPAERLIACARLDACAQEALRFLRQREAGGRPMPMSAYLRLCAGEAEIDGDGLEEILPALPEGAECALGVGRVSRRAVVEGERVEIRPMLTLTLTYDARRMTRAQAAARLSEVRARIELPALLVEEERV